MVMRRLAVWRWWQRWIVLTAVVYGTFEAVIAVQVARGAWRVLEPHPWGWWIQHEVTLFALFAIPAGCALLLVPLTPARIWAWRWFRAEARAWREGRPSPRFGGGKRRRQ